MKRFLPIVIYVISLITVSLRVQAQSSPIITATSATGTISSCQGSPSASPSIQQFSVSGNGLSTDPVVMAPVGFEISLSSGSGYGNSVVLSALATSTGGQVNNEVIYVRSAASAPAGNISGNVVLTSNGAASQSVVVNGTVNALPTVNYVSPQTATNGSATAPISFTGTGTTFNWVNDTPSIGLAASGTGDIPSFIPVNTSGGILTATVIVTPSASSGCSGIPQTFTISIYPVYATITAMSESGSISACQGSPSADPNIEQFNVSGSGLSADVFATAPPGFEVSLSPDNGYTNKVLLHAAVTLGGGIVNNEEVYVRSSASAPDGSISGSVALTSTGAGTQYMPVSGVVNALPIVNAVPNQAVNNGQVTTAINFTGTGSDYTWVNDTPTIGLAASGTGNIPAFTAVNNILNPIKATVTVTPQPSATNCTGIPVTFTITIGAAVPANISASGNITALNTIYGIPSSQSSFTVSGSNLTAGLLITPPTGFEVSTNGINFSNTIIVGSAGTVSSAIVYIRLAANTPVGTYAGNVVISTSNAGNITIATANSTVSPAILSIMANAVHKTYGSTLNNGTSSAAFTSTGLQNGENIGSVTMSYGISGKTNAIVNIYPGSATPSLANGGTFTGSNYTITYLPGDVIIDVAPLTITANNQTKNYGTANPALTISYTGFVNNDDTLVLSPRPITSTTAVITSPIGKYPITVSGALAANYTITYVPGTLTVMPTTAQLIIPNAFTPNGDGINDTWIINYIEYYPNCTVYIYNRYGEKVLSSIGYGMPWDGKYKNVNVPSGTYYYVIDTKSGGKVLSGWVAIVR